MEDHAFAADRDTDTYTLVEERQVLMCPPCGGTPTLRNAHFLKPIFSEKHTHFPPSPIFSENLKKCDLKKSMLSLYKTHPSEKWKIWVYSLKPKYQEIWKQAGIYEAILASTCKIPRNKDLIIGLAERWCAETNTFLFPWGEVTITLQDVMFLGGFSVLGALFLTPVADECVGIFDSLRNAYQEIRLVDCRRVSSSLWMEYFMCSGKQLEHEAFLAMWLSRFVLIQSKESIVVNAFHVAIHLSRGNRIALAPVVLASIYKDMRLLHNSIVESVNLEFKVCSSITLCHTELVHMWAWERFTELRPTPSVIEWTEPRSARWNGVKIQEIKDMRAALDSGKESFVWCPYVLTSSNCMLTKLYGDNEQWVVVESDDTESFARCLRVSELIGLGYIEQYLPHRVAMQFGLDQDVPRHVIRSNESLKTAWRSYNRSIRGRKLYIPPRLLESYVSTRYVIWWRGHLPVNEQVMTTCSPKEKDLPLISWGHKRRRTKLLTAPGYVERPDDYVEEDSLTVAQVKGRSTKTLPRKIKRFRMKNDLDDELVLKIHSGTESPAKLMTKSVISRVQSISSSIERPKNLIESLKEDAVVCNANHALEEVNNVNIELAKDEVESIEEETCDNADTDTHTLVEERQAAMCSPGGNPTLRNAHFLKPIFSEHQNQLPSQPTSLFSSKPNFENLHNYRLTSFKGSTSDKWRIWVHTLKPKYQEIWKQAGIYEAVLASTYKIPYDKELIMGLAERWCAETNTFIFPWGEVTITLEDVMFLGCYSVLGALFLTPLADECIGIYDSLRKAYKEIKLAGATVTALMWMEYFMSSGKQFEHEAFLVMWLSRFVLVPSHNKIVIKDFPVAIHLSRGTRIALAPVVLASIYTDMRLLHSSLVEFINLESEGRLRFILCHADLVQMWVWERFPKLRPTPSVMERGEARLALWNGVRILKVKDVRAALDSGKESFVWRPYVINSSNCMLSKLYRDNEQWVVVESDEIESLARCLRVSELVGLGYIEQYRPHRVAMQFGLDQDVPPHVMRSNKSPKTAWSNYNRSIRGTKLYIPARLFQSDVSSRYVVWWKSLLPVNEDMVTTCIQNERHLPLISWGHKTRRSRKTLSERTKISNKRIDLDDMQVLNTHSGTKTPAKLICMTELVKSSVQRLSSSDKCKESKSSTENPINPKENAVLSNANHAEVSNVSIELAKDEVVSKANCPENNIVNTEGESFDNTIFELTHLGLMARILRLEKIVEDIKAAKHDASISRGNLNSSSS